MRLLLSFACLSSALAVCVLDTWNSSSCTISTFSAVSDMICSCSGGYSGILDSFFFVGAPSVLRGIRFPNAGNITAVMPGAFSQFSNVQTIEITNSSLTLIQSGVFSPLIGNQLIDLSNNHITTIGLGAFSDMNDLTQVRLDHNQILDLDFGAVFGTSQFLALNLSDNLIEAVNISNFHIKTLNLNRNNIGIVQLVDSSIRELFLSDNPISSLSRSGFNNVSSLITLEIFSSPRLSYLEPGVFLCCPQLESLSLSLNFSKPGVFTNLSKLMALTLNVQEGLSQIVNVPLLKSINFVGQSPRFVSSRLTERANSTPVVSYAAGISFLPCLNGSTPTSTLGISGCSCEKNFLCTPLGPRECGFVVPAGEYNDSEAFRCPDCPSHLVRRGEGIACTLCDAGTVAVDGKCEKCSDFLLCPPGSLTPLPLEKFLELQRPPPSTMLNLVNSRNEGRSLSTSAITVIVVFAVAAVVCFFIPLIAQKYSSLSCVLNYFDLMSLAHRVPAGKSLVKHSTWLGVSTTCAFVCGAVIIAALLIDANYPVTEYGLEFRSVRQNKMNSITFSVTPWINDTQCLFNASYVEERSLIGYKNLSISKECSTSVRWNMVADTRLVFDVPIGAQMVKLATEFTGIFGSPAQIVDFLAPVPLNSNVFGPGATVKIEVSVRDASFSNELASDTSGLQVTLTKLDRGLPQALNSTSMDGNYWTLEVSFEMLDTSLWGRTYLPQTASQLFAAVFSVIMSLLAASRAVFAHGLEPAVAKCTKSKSAAKFPDEPATSVDIGQDDTIAELKKQVRNCVEAIEKLQREQAK